MIWRLDDIQKTLSLSDDIVKNLKNRTFGKVQFNSQHVKKDDIFIALKGRRDGHKFTIDAKNRGAALIIVSQNVLNYDPAYYIKVNDCFEALLALANYKRKISKAKFVGITGSTGKTSTKEALAMMLSAYGKTFMSRANFNNHLGVSINLASMPNDIKYAVIEMGMSALGEIQSLTNMVKPDIAIITSVAKAHLEFFDSVEQIADAKCEIFKGLNKEKGIAILNRDINSYNRCLENINKIGCKINNIKTFGEDINSDVFFESWNIVLKKAMSLQAKQSNIGDHVSYPEIAKHNLDAHNDCVLLKYKINDKAICFAMPYIPKHLAFNFAACFACIDVLGLDCARAIKQIKSYKPLKGRGNMVNVIKNNINYQIICDYYNSNPESLKAALANLKQFTCKNKTAIIGDMNELGISSAKLHEQMAEYILNANVNIALLVGKEITPLFLLMKNNAKYNHILLKHVKKVQELIALIDNYDILPSSSTILIKGSRGIALDQVAGYLGVTDVL